MLNEAAERIYINGRFLCHPTTGVQRYAAELLNAIDQEIYEKHSGRLSNWGTILAPKGARAHTRYRCLDVKNVGHLSGSAWEQLELPYYSREGLLINLSNIAPLIRRRQIVVIHDAAVFAAPNGYSLTFRLWYRFAHKVLAKRAISVATVSEFSQQELATYLTISKEKIAVIPNGSDHDLDAPAAEDFLTRYGLIRHEFILVVGSLHPNKNVGNAIRAALKLGSGSWPMVIVGASNPRVFSNSDIPQGVDCTNVIFAGRVTDAELNLLYGAAGCLLFPSLYEGFGIPPLEAMRHGVPVIASNRASIPEVCGEAAEYVDAMSVDSIASALSRIQMEPDLRSHLSVAGQKRAKRFSWRVSARILISEVARAGRMFSET